jgi:hypothetical protein
MNLENQLRDALRRQDPPEGFAERAIRQTGPAAARFRRVQPKPRFRWLWAALPAVAMAATLVLALSVQHRRAQEEQAGKQAIYALQIVAEELNMAQNEVLNK